MHVTRGARSHALSSALRRGSHCRGERGVAAVEFAIILPLLMMLLFGIMGFGFAMAQTASLASGVREGARLGAVSGVPNVVGGVVTPDPDHECGDVIAQTRAQAQTIAVQPNDVAVVVRRVTSSPANTTVVCQVGVGGATPASTTPPCTDPAATAATLATIEVTATVTDREFIIPVPGATILTPDTLEKKAEYRCEYH